MAARGGGKVVPTSLEDIQQTQENTLVFVTIVKTRTLHQHI
jgi:hypothetical protein